MLSRIGQRCLDAISLRAWNLLAWLTPRTKVIDPLASKNQQIAELQRELSALRLAKAQGTAPGSSTGSPLADQLLAQANLQVNANGALQPVLSASAIAPSMTAQVPAPATEPTVTDVPFTEEVAAAPEPVEEEPPKLLSQRLMDIATAEPTMPAETPPPEPRTFMPDVKMLAPLLKIALSVLTIEQMVEVGLHVKQGAPGFKEFLDSEVAKEKFRELYGTYCEFLAGKVK
jgi:hypothetical protein